MIRSSRAALVAVGVLWTLAGCGGSSGGAPDTTPPTVSTIAPSDGGMNIGSQSTVWATLSEALDCNALASDAITVSEGASVVDGATTCSGATLTFTATSSLPTRAALTAEVSTSVRDLAGNRLQVAYQWHFSVSPWTQRAGTAGNDVFNSVAVDSSGNVHAAGGSDGPLFDSTPAGLSDAVVVKYDRLGAVQWSVMLGTNLSDEARAIAVDGSGNVYVGGTTDGDLGGVIGNTSTDAFVAKFNSVGERLWLRQLHSPGYDFLRGLAVDASGNVVVCGYTDGSLFATFQGGASELFIAKFDGAGTLVWGYQDGTGTVADAAAVTTDASGNVYATGFAVGGLDGNADTGSYDAFVTKLSPVGVRQWTNQFGTSGNEFASALALDNAGNILVAGRTDSSAMDGQSSAGMLDAFVVKLDPSGQRQWTRLAGSAADEIPTGIAVDASGDVVVAGYTFGAFPTFVNAGGSDGFAFRLDAQGSSVWTQQWGSAGYETVTEASLDDAGAAFVSGWTSGSVDGIPNSGGLDALVVKIDRAGKAR